VDDVHLYSCAQLALLLKQQPGFELVSVVSKLATFRKRTRARVPSRLASGAVRRREHFVRRPVRALEPPPRWTVATVGGGRLDGGHSASAWARRNRFVYARFVRSSRGCAGG
jgi:hypothetical protein